MKKKVIWGTVLALSVTALAGANIYSMNKSVDVTLAAVEEGAVTETVYASGKVEAVNVQHYFAPASGVVLKLEVKPGDKVKKGQALYTLRTDELEQQLRMERNNLKMAEAERENARKQNEAAGDNPLLPKQEIDLSIYDLKIENAKMSIEALEKKIAAAKVTAAKDGVVTKVDAKEGQMVMDGAAVLTVADLSALQVRANLSELDAGKVKTDLPVSVTGDAFAESYKGKVTYLAPVADLPNPAAKDPVVEMLVTLDSTAPELRPGYNATVEIQLKEEKTHPLAPLEAVQHEGDNAYVYKVENGKAVKVSVKTGKEDEEHVEILEGLSAGDEIIASIPDGLKAGKKVNVQ
jgi:RND family efflux transporter MFP subunit